MLPATEDLGRTVAWEECMDLYGVALPNQQYSDRLDALAAEPRFGQIDQLMDVIGGPNFTGRHPWRVARVLCRDGFRCVYCGRDFTADVDSLLLVRLDHMMPRSAGGRDVLSNLVAACTTCDRLKRNAPAQSIDEARRIVAERRADRAASFTRWLATAAMGD